METRARHVLIGLFTLAAAVLAVLFALWLGKSQSERDFHTYDIAFAEAVSGLSRGSTVEYNGIRVGEVTDLRLDPKNPKNVYARVRIESGAPVRTDTQATLMPVGITGTSQIRLSSGSDPAGRPLLSSTDSIPVIHATPSPMGKLLASGEDVLYNFNQILISARAAFSDENIQRMNKTLEHIEQTTGALAGQRGTLTRSITDFNQATLQAKTAFSEMHKLMRAGNQIASGDLKQALASTSHAMTSFEKSMGTLEAVVQDNHGSLSSGAQGLSQIGPTLTELRGTLNTLQGVMRQFDNDPAGYLLNREPMKEFAP